MEGEKSPTFSKIESCLQTPLSALDDGNKVEDATNSNSSKLMTETTTTGSLVTASLVKAAVEELSSAKNKPDNNNNSNNNDHDLLAQAVGEHSSVASFSKFALQLMALGAPSPLLLG